LERIEAGLANRDQKIISGGQTDADRAAMELTIENGTERP